MSNAPAPARASVDCVRSDYVTQQELTKPVVASAVVGIDSRNARACRSEAGNSTIFQPTTPCSSSCASSAHATVRPSGAVTWNASGHGARVVDGEPRRVDVDVVQRARRPSSTRTGRPR